MIFTICAELQVRDNRGLLSILDLGGWGGGGGGGGGPGQLPRAMHHAHNDIHVICKLIINNPSARINTKSRKNALIYEWNMPRLPYQFGVGLCACPAWSVLVV